jgi:hypothetical protein
MNAAHDTQDDEILWYSNIKEARQCVSLDKSSTVSDANAFSGANIPQRFHVSIVTKLFFLRQNRQVSKTDHRITQIWAIL